MRYHVLCTDMAGASRLIACFVSIEAAVACRVRQDAAKDPSLCYWIQPTTCCTCDSRPSVRPASP